MGARRGGIPAPGKAAGTTAMVALLLIGGLLGAAPLATVATAAPGSGGSAVDPDIPDPAGDVGFGGGMVPSPIQGPLTDVMDIRGVWFHDATDETLSVSMRLTSLDYGEVLAQVPTYQGQYAVTFTIGHEGPAFQAHASHGGLLYQSAGTDPGWRFGLLNGTGNWTDVEGHADLPTATLTIILPREAIDATRPGTVLTDPWAQTWASYAYADPVQPGDRATPPRDTTLTPFGAPPVQAADADPDPDGANAAAAPAPARPGLDWMNGWTAAFGLVVLASALGVWSQRSGHGPPP